MTSRSTASPSRLPSSAVPWILMCSTATGFAPGTRSGMFVCTWAVSHEPDTTANVIAHAMNNFVAFIRTLSRKTRLLHRVGIDVHAEGAHGDRCGQRSQRLFFDLNLGFFIDLNGCVDGVRRHAPQLSSACELRSVDCELDALFRVGWVEHGNCQDLAVITQRGAHIKRVSIAARVDRRLVAACRECGLGLRRIRSEERRVG